jgi:hypothetical protein
MPLFFSSKEDRNRLTRSPPGPLRQTGPFIPRISERRLPLLPKGTPLLGAQLPVEPTTNDTVIGDPVHSQDNTLPVQTPPARDTHFPDDTTVRVNPPTQDPVQSDTRQVGLYHTHTQGNPEIEDIITRTRRQVALAVEAEIAADRATEAARAAVEEAQRLLGELEREIGAE